MRFLVDANLSPRVAERVRVAGHEAVHVADIGLVNADDDVILERAVDADEVIVTADRARGEARCIGTYMAREAGTAAACLSRLTMRTWTLRKRR